MEILDCLSCLIENRKKNAFVLKGVTWVLGNGEFVRFWLDSRVENEGQSIKLQPQSLMFIFFAK